MRETKYPSEQKSVNGGELSLLSVSGIIKNCLDNKFYTNEKKVSKLHEITTKVKKLLVSNKKEQIEGAKQCLKEINEHIAELTKYTKKAIC